jgi:hypothetical protein
MTNLPSGTVTFLFTNIEGRTMLARTRPSAMATEEHPCTRIQKSFVATELRNCALGVVGTGRNSVVALRGSAGTIVRLFELQSRSSRSGLQFRMLFLVTLRGSAGIRIPPPVRQAQGPEPVEGLTRRATSGEVSWEVARWSIRTHHSLRLLTSSATFQLH